jgi:hypothetical protein
MPAKKKAEYTQPATKDNLQEFYDRESGKEKEPDEGRVFQELSDEDKKAYVGVDPIYQNYASDTDKPLLPEEGPEAETFKRAAEEEELLQSGGSRAEEPEEEAEEEADNEPGEATPVAPPAPPATPDNK